MLNSRPIVVKANIPVSHLCPPSPVPSTLHLFLLAFAAECCPMYRFPISLLSLQSIPIRLSACSSLLNSTLSNAFHNPQSRYIHPDHSVYSSLLVLLMFLLHP